ncbi:MULTISPECIES: hypothetical protein [unclassified Bartonella]|uniref:hypothetical protein n=1 Tax=unclassified Bartonella TaxID=2645622 RepID=UPI00300DF62D
MSLLSHSHLVIALVIVVALSSFFYGRSFERSRTLIQAVSAFQNREKINDEIFFLSPFHVCLALGGMPDECATVLRGMDEATKN